MGWERKDTTNSEQKLYIFLRTNAHHPKRNPPKAVEVLHESEWPRFSSFRWAHGLRAQIMKPVFNSRAITVIIRAFLLLKNHLTSIFDSYAWLQSHLQSFSSLFAYLFIFLFQLFFLTDKWASRLLWVRGSEEPEEDQNINVCGSRGFRLEWLYKDL